MEESEKRIRSSATKKSYCACRRRKKREKIKREKGGVQPNAKREKQRQLGGKDKEGNHVKKKTRRAKEWKSARMMSKGRKRAGLRPKGPRAREQENKGFRFIKLIGNVGYALSGTANANAAEAPTIFLKHFLVLFHTIISRSALAFLKPMHLFPVCFLLCSVL